MPNTVKIPRFYVNILEWAAENNYSYEGFSYSGIDSIFRTLPVIPKKYVNDTSFIIPADIMDDFSFVAVLGHILNSYEGTYGITDFSTGMAKIDVVNSDTVNGYDGFSINTFSGAAALENHSFWVSYPNPDPPPYDVDLDNTNIGSVIIGSYYDMINAPNLSLTLEREYGTTKEYTTYNGSSRSNTFNNSVPVWGQLGAWELAKGINYPPIIPNLAKSGRRKWQLKFSFMDDGDLWGSNQSLGQGVAYGNNPTYTDDDDVSDDADYFNLNLISDRNFFSQVWNKTDGGTLPFLFQPDNTNNNPDGFAICRFTNTFKATQTSPGFYDIALSIEEVY